ncbi:MAG: hypothetical protein DKT66_18340 [Candidatus Melainabacteria bacterium]|nr:MAG: hypothetical protein DKT66_18340 [Candidatus Melainabacteria bacterium]
MGQLSILVFIKSGLEALAGSGACSKSSFPAAEKQVIMPGVLALFWARLEQNWLQSRQLVT